MSGLSSILGFAGARLDVLSSTHSFAELELSPAAYDEIAGKLRDAGYHHSFCDNGAIDMHGIGITRKEVTPRICVRCKTPEGEPHPFRHPAFYV